MGRVCLCLVVMSLFCGVSKVEAQVQNIREKQDSVSVIKLSENIMCTMIVNVHAVWHRNQEIIEIKHL